MIVIIAVIGLWISVAFDTLIPFAISIVIALGLRWMTNLWIHSHIHESIKHGEEEHGIETID